MSNCVTPVHPTLIYTVLALFPAAARSACLYRHWDSGNGLMPQSINLYSLENYLHETLLQSEHRLVSWLVVNRLVGQLVG